MALTWIGEEDQDKGNGEEFRCVHAVCGVPVEYPRDLMNRH